MAYVDTSVLAAYYCPEPLSAVVQAELARISGPTLSSLVEVELSSAVAMKVRRGELDATSANRVLSQFQVHLSGGYYRNVHIGPGEFALARDWIGRFATPLRTLDALHLATAFSHGLPIVTADVGLARSAAILGVAHRLLS